MDLPAAMTTWAGAGAAENARRSLDRWSRAQDEVTALLGRLDHRDTERDPAADDRRPVA